MIWVVAVLIILQVAVLVVLRANVGTLKGLVGRLEASAKNSLEAAVVLQLAVEEVKRLDAEDRSELKRLLMLALQISLAIGRGEAAYKRIEDHASGVADDLAAAHRRADAVDNTDAGSAADAAARQTEKEKREEG